MFYIAVRTTGLSAGHSCPSRDLASENVEFYSRAEDAVFAGYRPCKALPAAARLGRRAGMDRDPARPRDENPGERIPDAEIRAMGIEPARAFDAYFQDRFGMTFQAYCRGRRLGSALSALRAAAAVSTMPSYDHGYESHSGFRDAFTRIVRCHTGTRGCAHAACG